MTTTPDTTMNDIADSLDEAADNLGSGLLPGGGEIQEFASKTVYSTFYYFSYGVCFVGYLAGKVIPKTGVVGQGLRDGSEAAREAVERVTSSSHTLEAEFGDPIPLDASDEEKPQPKVAKRKPSAKPRRAKKTA